LPDLIAQLNAYYRDQRIHPLDFRCPSFDSCSSSCQNFTKARTSLIGQHYGDPIRVVVLSLDPGAGWEEPEERTFEAVHGRQTRMKIGALPKNRHWYRTHETVAALLSRFGDSLSPEDVRHRFAHVNAAKCTQNLPSKKQAPAHMFRNCRPYLEGELAILAPHVIITQGRRAAKPLEAWKRDGRSNVIEVGGRPAYWLELVHPTAWGGVYLQERKKWPQRFARARRWVESQDVGGER
jgi:uracil-DNA glycosylase